MIGQAPIGSAGIASYQQPPILVVVDVRKFEAASDNLGGDDQLLLLIIKGFLCLSLDVSND